MPRRLGRTVAKFLQLRHKSLAKSDDGFVIRKKADESLVIDAGAPAKAA